MKLLPLIFLPVSPVSAQIFADVSTTLGEFSIELYHEESPRAVANFITLAEGTRAWIDSTTGEVKNNTPYYDGIIFHRVIDDFMNQAGSQNGTGSDGPGYSFPDEVANGLLHDEPYLLSAANSGPNTNGSQFFTTVVPTPWLDGIHTVYGKIVTGTDTIDTINNTPVIGSRPVTPVVIQSVTIRRVGDEAQQFDEFGQGLPTVLAVDARIEPSEGDDDLDLIVGQSPGTSLSVFRSGNLQDWIGESRYLGADGSALSSYSLGGALKREFIRTNLIDWPSDGTFPDSVMGRTVTLETNIGVFTLEFLEQGTLTLVQPESSPLVATIDYENSVFDHDGYGATWLIYSDGLVPFRFRVGADLPIVSPESGRMSGTAFNVARTSLNGTFSIAE